MDNLTHSLFGWTIARAGLGRRVPYATATLILASNAPDVDIVAGFRSGVERGRSASDILLTVHVAQHQAACKRYELSDRNILGERTTAPPTPLVSDTGADVVHARVSRAGRIYFDFARFPVAQVSTHTGTFTSVRLLDARFMMMPLASGNATNARLSVTITFDESGRTVEEHFGNSARMVAVRSSRARIIRRCPIVEMCFAPA